MKPGYLISINHGLGLCSRYPIIGVFNFCQNYRAHACKSELLEECNAIAVFTNIKPKPCKQPQ